MGCAKVGVWVGEITATYAVDFPRLQSRHPVDDAMLLGELPNTSNLIR